MGRRGSTLRGHIVIFLGKLAPPRGSREYDGVAWGSVPGWGPLAKRSPRHMPGSRRVPKSPCTPFPCHCRPSVSYCLARPPVGVLPRGPQIFHGLLCLNSVPPGTSAMTRRVVVRLKVCVGFPLQFGLALPCQHHPVSSHRFWTNRSCTLGGCSDSPAPRTDSAASTS